MSRIDIVVAPFHAGTSRYRVGKGPHRLLEAGLADALRGAGTEIRIVEVAPVDTFEGEIGRSFEVKRRVAAAVRTAVQARRFPLVLAGNCNACVGTYAGLADPGVQVVWFDAHPDFSTPDEVASGYFDSMGAATLAGQCWHRLTTTIPGFRPLDLSRLIYCGIRDFEPGQREKVEMYAMSAIYGGQNRDINFADELDNTLTGTAGRVLVHLDLDCLDTSVGYANEYAAPGGLSSDDLADCMTRVLSHTAPAAMTIASFNPDLPGSEAIASAGIRAAAIVVQAALRA